MEQGRQGGQCSYRLTATLHSMSAHDQASLKQTLNDEALQKIGRNVLLFQKIEGLLKFLATNQRVEGPVAGISEHQRKRSEKIQIQSMGQLVGTFTDDILADAGEISTEAEKINQPWMSLRFQLNDESGSNESLKTELGRMVKARNDLVHHFLPRWQPDSQEHLIAAITSLDQDHENAFQLLGRLQSIAASMNTTKQIAGKFFSSDDFAHKFELLWLQQSTLVILLQQAANEKSRPDGWSYLSNAGQIIRRHEPDEVEHIKERYGVATLRQLLIASEMFDVFDEPTSNNNFRTLFRMKQPPENWPNDH